MVAGRIRNFAFFLLTFYFLKLINQFESIMQNKPNLPDAQMNITSFYTKDYGNNRLADVAKTKPIQTQYKAKTNPISEKPKMNVTSILTKDYENKSPSSPKKTNPIQTQYKPNQTQYLTALRLRLFVLLWSPPLGVPKRTYGGQVLQE